MFKMWSISQEVNITNFQRNEAILHSILLFRCRKYMSSHMMRFHTPDNLKPFVCKICTKGFLYKNQIDDHMNIHYGLKPHKCKYCDQTFANVSNKLAHQRSTHEGIKRKK